MTTPKKVRKRSLEIMREMGWDKEANGYERRSTPTVYYGDDRLSPQRIDGLERCYLAAIVLGGGATFTAISELAGFSRCYVSYGPDWAKMAIRDIAGPLRRKGRRGSGRVVCEVGR